jgi:hypothetical protein
MWRGVNGEGKEIMHFFWRLFHEEKRVMMSEKKKMA